MKRQLLEEEEMEELNCEGNNFDAERLDFAADLSL